VIDGDPMRVDRWRLARVLAAALPLWSVPVAVAAWGDVGHQLIVERAATAVPEPLRSFAVARVAALAEAAVEPDRIWRHQCGYDEAIRHFFHLDAHGGDPLAISPDIADLYARKHEGWGRDHGLLPWRIAELGEHLVGALRSGDLVWAAALMGQLSHYTGDLANPFHLTADSDGREVGQDGLHARWETALIERESGRIRTALAASPVVEVTVADPLSGCFAAMLGAGSRRRRVLAADRAAWHRHGYETGAYYGDLWKRAHGELNEQLVAGAQLTAGVWWWAYEQAGRPTLQSDRTRKEDDVR
jgi:hypothetical protein